MPEYIERDNLVGKFLEKQFSSTSNLIHIAEAIRLTNKQPTADVVEVVRCKVCKYWDYGRCEGIENGLTREYTSPMDFCSYGAKMDKE